MHSRYSCFYFFFFYFLLLCCYTHLFVFRFVSFSIGINMPFAIFLFSHWLTVFSFRKLSTTRAPTRHLVINTRHWAFSSSLSVSGDILSFQIRLPILPVWLDKSNKRTHTHTQTDASISCWPTRRPQTSYCWA